MGNYITTMSGQDQIHKEENSKEREIGEERE
jgi:hypothetical protein